MADTLELALDLTRSGQLMRQPPREIEGRDFLAILGLYTKACKTFRAITLCCEAGLGQDAQALGRMLLEATLAATFIMEEEDGTGRRGRMFVAHQIVHKLKQIKAFEDVPDLRDLIPVKAVKSLEAQIQKVRAELGDEEVDKIARTSFCGERLATYAAQRSALRVPYNILYREGSANLHCADLLQHVTVADDKPVLKMIPGDDWIRQVTMALCSTLLVLLTSMNTFLGIGEDQRLGELTLRLVNISSDS